MFLSDPAARRLGRRSRRQPAFVEVRRVAIGDRLGLVAFGEDHDVVGADIPRGIEIPATMDDARTAEEAEGVPVAIVPEADIVDAAGRRRGALGHRG